MLKKTPLYEAHENMKAKIGEFAGYSMPLFYDEGVLQEHKWVRSHAGIFDVSHMGQIIIEGDGAALFLEKITPSSFQNKKPGRAQYTVLTNEEGGIVDDLIITRLSENRFYAVINAGCKDKDIAWIREHLPAGIMLHNLEDLALIAFQGGWTERILYEIFDVDTHDLPYMHAMETTMLYGTPVTISRLGYTGEDGFEISLPENKAVEAWRRLADHPEVKPIGLAARDSLRLDMGYPLYGHDIDATTSPVEAGLEWIIGKDNTGFIGAERILHEYKNAPVRKRVGIKLQDKGIAREGAEIRNSEDKIIGTLTSGGFSPTLEEAIGMGYVEAEAAEISLPVFVHVRGRNIAAEIVPMPFVTPKTKSMKKPQAA